MREIKFRAWDTKRKIMITPDNLNIVFGIKNALVFEYIQTRNALSYWQENKNLIVMQFTGLKDKKGKEIYEGDIVKHSWNQVPFDNSSMVSENSEIIWVNYSWYMGICPLSIFVGIIEVIGNIYETPKLLGDEDAEV